MKTYRAAILGLGRMGNTIDDEIPPSRDFMLPYGLPGACQAVQQLDLVAGCDLLAEKRTDFSERWGVPAVYEDLDEMLAKEQPDLVAICTRADVHSELAVRVANAGVPMMYLEKAIACSPREADAVLAACQAHGTVFNSGVLNRFSKTFGAARDLIDQGRIGEPKAGIQYAGRSLLHGHIHTVDGLSYLLGDPRITRVRGELHPRDLEIVDGRLDDDPLATYHLEFENGVEAWSIPAGHHEFEIVGTEGVVRTLNNAEGLALRVNRPTDSSRHREWHSEPLPEVKKSSSVVACLEDLIEAHETGRPTLNHIEQAHHVTEACFAIAESHRQGGAWVDLPLTDRDLYIYHV
jgi:predicted dehydrogenase